MALDGSRILAVGNNAAIRKLAGPDTRIIDLGGRLLLPGFNDSHVHFLIGGGSLITVHLGTANSQAEFKGAHRSIRQNPAQRVRGFAMAFGIINAGIRPFCLDHQLIDDVSGDHPAFLWRLDGHMALVNAQAMKLAGIDRNTKDVPGGDIERDKDGNPTGILKDAAIALVQRIMPPLSPKEESHAMEAAMREAAAHGVTSVQNMADSSWKTGAASRTIFASSRRSSALAS